MKNEKDLTVTEDVVEKVSKEEALWEYSDAAEKEQTTLVRNLLKIYHVVLDILLRIVFVFRDLGLGIWRGLLGIKNVFVKFGKRFKDGSTATKVSHIIMGAGNFARKQYIKGAIFLSLQILFIAFMVTSPTNTNTPLGGKAIANFFSLGDYHGMPIDENYDFEKDYIEIKGISYKDNIEKIYRINSLLEAIENNDSDVVLKDNDGALTNADGDAIYPTRTYKKVLYDNRYGTNDCYGYADLSKQTNIDISNGTVLSIISETPLEIYDIDLQFYVDASTTDCGIYGREVLRNGKTSYQYLVIIQTNANKGNVLELDIDGTNLEIIKIDYDVNFVNRDIDFSFLMLLFGVITFAIIAIFLVVYNLNIASSYKADKDIAEGNKPSTFIEDLKSLLDSRFHITLLTPAIIFLIVFTVVPTLLMIMIAFTDMSSNAASSGQKLINWTGFRNFADLFSGSGSGGSEIANEVGKNFTSVLAWTFEWALIATFTCYFGGIFLALLINKKDVNYKKVWRTIFILTIAIPQFITLLVIRNLLSGSGPINAMLQQIGLIDKPIDFLQTSSTAVGSNARVWLARCSVLVINLYIGVPYTMLMTSGILMNIPKDLYEAATIDGANKWQMFRKITLPYIIFVTTPYLISSFIGNITSFNTIFLTTGGGPSKGAGNIAGHTDLLVTWLYKLTMQGGNSKYNAGSIIGILTFLITAFITLVCYRNSKAYKEEDTFQ